MDLNRSSAQGPRSASRRRRSWTRQTSTTASAGSLKHSHAPVESVPLEGLTRAGCDTAGFPTSLCSGPLAAANAVHRPRVRRGIVPPCALASFPPEALESSRGQEHPRATQPVELPPPPRSAVARPRSDVGSLGRGNLDSGLFMAHPAPAFCPRVSAYNVIAPGYFITRH